MEFVDTSIIEQIEMKMIRPSSFAVRDKFQKYCEDDESLIISIREHGLIQPILIRPLSHGFEIVAGHRRYQACKSLRWRFIPCKIREMTNKQAFEIQLSENIQRKSMDPIEEAEVLEDMLLILVGEVLVILPRKLEKAKNMCLIGFKLSSFPKK